MERQVKMATLTPCIDPGASSPEAGELEWEAGQGAQAFSKLRTVRSHTASEQKRSTLRETTDSHGALLVFDVKTTELHN